MTDEEFQNSQFPAPLQDAIYAGANVDQLPDAQGEFGRSPGNPIPVNGPLGEVLYLSNVICYTGQKVLFHRLGSADRIDVYETITMDGSRWDLFYLDAYHPRKSRKAPFGYNVGEARERDPCIYGTNMRVVNFPLGLDEAIRKCTRDLIGFPLPIPKVKEALESMQSERPGDQDEKIKTLERESTNWERANSV